MRIFRNVLFCILCPLALLLVLGGIGAFIVGFIMNATGLGTDTAFFKFFDEPLTGGLTIFGSIIIGGILLYVSFLLDPDFSSAHYDEPVYTPTAPVRRPTTDSGIHGSVTIGGNRQSSSSSTPRPAASAPARPTAPPAAPQTTAPATPSVPLDPFALPGSAFSYESAETESASTESEPESIDLPVLQEGAYMIGSSEYSRDGEFIGYTTESGNCYDADGDLIGFSVGDTRYDEDGNKTGYRAGDTEYDADGNVIGYYTVSGNFHTVD